MNWFVKLSLLFHEKFDAIKKMADLSANKSNFFYEQLGKNKYF